MVNSRGVLRLGTLRSFQLVEDELKVTGFIIQEAFDDFLTSDFAE